MNRRSLFTILIAAPWLASDAEARTSRANAAGTSSSSDAATAVAIVSQYRRTGGLPPVALNAAMNAAAQQQARTIASLGYLEHGDFQGRVRSFGIRGQAAENLAYGINTVNEAIGQWIASGSHRQNLLLPNATRMGLGRADSSSARFWAMVIG